MSDYASLVSKILSNDILQQAVQDMVDEKTLNLVCDDWASRLENDITYQDFASPTESLWKQTYTTPNYEYDETKRLNFNVVLVGHCKIAKPYGNRASKPAVMVTSSEPLDKIARVMLSDLGPQIQISNDFKFSFTECSVLSCNDCSSCSEMFAKSGYKLTQLNQPCILDTKVFDGKRVVNRFLSQVECMFRQSFVAIMHLNINSRYSFNTLDKQIKVHRISGDILEIVGFGENKLSLVRKLDVGPLVNLDLAKEPPESDFLTSAENLMTMMSDEGDGNKRPRAGNEPREFKKLKFGDEEGESDFYSELKKLI